MSKAAITRRGRAWALPLAGALCLLAISGVPAPAAADGAPDQRLVDRARELFIIATKHYEAGRYRTATRAFQASLALVDRASTRFNLARTWQRLGQPRLAAVEYSAYLAAYPDAPDREAVRKLIGELNRDTAGDADRSEPARTGPTPSGDRPRRAQAGLPLPLPELDEPLDPGAGPSYTDDPAAAAVRGHSGPAPSAGLAQPTARQRLPAYAAFATSGVTALAALWFGVSAMDGRQELAESSVPDRTAGGRRDAMDLADSVSSDALVADVLGVAALTAAAAGVWMYVSPPVWADELLEGDAGEPTAPGGAGDAGPQPSDLPAQ